ncbi:MAG TPA: hypothetical protein PLQ00_11515, partial [Thermoguttaceae bacterium]|nr:hypothetical protein [Thermoguttaceae bacterium]
MAKYIWQQGWGRWTAVFMVLATAGWAARAAQADYVPMDTVYAYHDSGTGGAYLKFSGDQYQDIYIPSGQLPGPYGGWFDGNSGPYPMSPAHPGFPFQFRNGVADIPLYIFDTEPGGYIVSGSGAASYLRMD